MEMEKIFYGISPGRKAGRLRDIFSKNLVARFLGKNPVFA